MNYLTKSSSIIPNEYTQIKDYNHYVNKTSNYNPRMYFKYCCHTCHCHCHCHNLKNQLFQKIYCSGINNINPINSNLEQKYKYHQPIRNRSANNLIISDNDSFEKLKQKYYPNDNENMEKQNTLIPKNNYNLEKNDVPKFETDNNYNYQDLKLNNKEKVKNNNYSYDYRNIKPKKKEKYDSYNNNLNNLNNINLNTNNNNLFLNRNEVKVKPVKSFQIKRKELSQYYHIVNPKKYSYGGETLETVNSTNNHQYKEVFGTSNSKDDKILPKSRVIYYSEAINNDDISNKKYLKSGLKNELINKIKNQQPINYRYISYQNSPNNITRNIYSVAYESKTLKPKIINETNNTKFVESKDLQKTQSEKFLYNPKGEIIYRNNLNNIYKNNISNGLDISNSIDNSNKNPNYNHYTTNIKNKNNNSNINNIKSIPKSYSQSNINNFNNFKEINSYKLKANINNDDINNDFTQNNNQNKKDNNNNTDYETIKLKVKLALLRKQQYEQQRQQLFNNENKPKYKEYINDNKKYLEKFLSKGNTKPIITNDNYSLVSKTKKLLEDKKMKNMGKNNSNMPNNDNKILFSLIKNLKEKNNDYNKNIIKPKLKVWKP